MGEINRREEHVAYMGEMNRREEHVAYMGEIRNAYNILVRTHE
jgi:hypothetical protein